MKRDVSIQSNGSRLSRPSTNRSSTRSTVIETPTDAPASPLKTLVQFQLFDKNVPSVRLIDVNEIAAIEALPKNAGSDIILKSGQVVRVSTWESEIQFVLDTMVGGIRTIRYDRRDDDTAQALADYRVSVLGWPSQQSSSSNPPPRRSFRPIGRPALQLDDRTSIPPDTDRVGPGTTCDDSGVQIDDDDVYYYETADGEILRLSPEAFASRVDSVMAEFGEWIDLDKPDVVGYLENNALHFSEPAVGLKPADSRR